jgi:AI-2 transport protein TqsA
LKQAVTALAAAAADALTEAVLVGIYLVFLLVEAGRVPQRIQSAFSDERPDQILAVVGNINDAMASYLRVKIKASLVLAIPATLVLWAFDIRFALMWGILTFLLNFIPYLGSIIACGAPLILAFLQMDSLERPAIAGVLLISIHTLSAYVVEPAMTGKAVGLSPVVILVALSFWGLCWGLIGMLLAVPLTVMVKIVLENVAFTRPFARLMAED